MSTIDTSGIRIIETSERGGVILAYTRGPIPTTTKKFEEGCLLIASDANLYVNAGTYASPLFKMVSHA